jgi:hypothetical protein
VIETTKFSVNAHNDRAGRLVDRKREIRFLPNSTTNRATFGVQAPHGQNVKKPDATDLLSFRPVGSGASAGVAPPLCHSPFAPAGSGSTCPWRYPRAARLAQPQGIKVEFELRRRFSLDVIYVLLKAP